MTRHRVPENTRLRRGGADRIFKLKHHCNQAIANSIEGAAGSQYRSRSMNKFIIAAGTIAGIMLGASAVAQTKPTIPVIRKDFTSPYWQAVLAGARKGRQGLC